MKSLMLHCSLSNQYLGDMHLHQGPAAEELTALKKLLQGKQKKREKNKKKKREENTRRACFQRKTSLAWRL